MAAVAAMKRRDRALADSLPTQPQELPLKGAGDAASSESDDEVGQLIMPLLTASRKQAQRDVASLPCCSYVSCRRRHSCRSSCCAVRCGSGWI